MSGSDARRVVFFCTTNNVQSTVWDNVLQFRANYGYWRFIIVTRYLLLEIIDAVGAHELLGIEKCGDGSLRPIE
jgi:hypothetical protein